MAGSSTARALRWVSCVPLSLRQRHSFHQSPPGACGFNARAFGAAFAETELARSDTADNSMRGQQLVVTCPC